MSITQFGGDSVRECRGGCGTKFDPADFDFDRDALIHAKCEHEIGCPACEQKVREKYGGAVAVTPCPPEQDITSEEFCRKLAAAQARAGDLIIREPKPSTEEFVERIKARAREDRTTEQIEQEPDAELPPPSEEDRKRTTDDLSDELAEQVRDDPAEEEDRAAAPEPVPAPTVKEPPPSAPAPAPRKRRQSPRQLSLLPPEEERKRLHAELRRLQTWPVSAGLLRCRGTVGANQVLALAVVWGLALCDESKRLGYAFIKCPTLAWYMDACPSAARGWLKDLERGGYIITAKAGPRGLLVVINADHPDLQACRKAAGPLLKSGRRSRKTRYSRSD